MSKRIKLNKPLDYYGMPNFEDAVEQRKHQHLPVKFTRVWSMANHQTFKIPAIKRLLDRYVPKKGYDWVDPFCGDNSPAFFRNDHHPDRGNPGAQHLEALEFVKWIKDQVEPRNDYTPARFGGAIFDPPYSFRQISEHYKLLGQKATKKDTSMAFYEKVKSELADLVEVGGYAISFGWNTNGFGITRGFRIVEILMVAHGGSRNDTIVVVERKV